jgi:hypothetical protein
VCGPEVELRGRGEPTAAWVTAPGQ